jgi:hypothetical protein
MIFSYDKKTNVIIVYLSVNILLAETCRQHVKVHPFCFKAYWQIVISRENYLMNHM